MISRECIRLTPFSRWFMDRSKIQGFPVVPSASTPHSGMQPYQSGPLSKSKITACGHMASLLLVPPLSYLILLQEPRVSFQPTWPSVRHRPSPWPPGRSFPPPSVFLAAAPILRFTVTRVPVISMRAVTPPRNPANSKPPTAPADAGLIHRAPFSKRTPANP